MAQSMSMSMCVCVCACVYVCALVSTTNPLLKAIDEVHVCRYMSVQPYAWTLHYLVVKGVSPLIKEFHCTTRLLFQLFVLIFSCIHLLCY